jgi:hypothetical protein
MSYHGRSQASGWNGPVARAEPPFPPDRQSSRIRRAREEPHPGNVRAASVEVRAVGKYVFPTASHPQTKPGPVGPARPVVPATQGSPSQWSRKTLNPLLAHYSSVKVVFICWRYRLRCRAVFAWNVPQSAADAFTAFSRCRPSSRADLHATYYDGADSSRSHRTPSVLLCLVACASVGFVSPGHHHRARRPARRLLVRRQDS